MSNYLIKLKKLGVNITLLTSSIVLVACGGGGSDGYFNQDGGSGNGSGSTDGGTTAEVRISNIELYDTNNLLTRTVTVQGATAKVKVTNASGQAISSALVTFSGSGVTFGTTNNAVLTNAEGEASISLKPSNTTDTGSHQISATVIYNGISSTSSPYYFTLQASNITLANMTAESTLLESGASTNITLKTQDAVTGINQNDVTVNFSATCGKFEPSSMVSSNQGDITTTYTAVNANGNLCEGLQTITATGSNTAISNSIQVNIANIQANSIVYSSDPVNLGIQRSGSASSGQIEYTIYSNGKPATNQDVRIELMRGPEDISFITPGNRLTKIVKSNSSGKVIINLYPGNKPGPVEIKASLALNSNIFALSKNVTISTGRVTQDGLSLSVDKNSLQNDVDGDSATIVARMVDRVGNPVPDGTSISFVAEGGSIMPNCSTVGGACTVKLITQNPRPADNRVTVLAYVEGDKTYEDLDGDNLYTAGIDKLSSNIGDFFRDDNEDNIYNSNLGEFLYKRGASGTACTDSKFVQPNIPSTCDNNLDAVIRQQLLFAFATDTPTISDISLSNTQFSFKLFGNSARSVPMPTGTTVAVKVEDNTKNNELSCSAELRAGGATVPNVFDLKTPSAFRNNEQVNYEYRLKECAAGDTIILGITAPNGKIKSVEYTIR
ncbi:MULTISPECIES: Ig-like domain-containing protein [Acinetobacter]|jgi:hypothetical protein|uniref:Big-1 domain-containing protein n=1 Tax=Acinetobacter radioresistens TaxID=40216 RepID=A0A8H2JZN4_ACIRA|nr:MULTISPECIES: Ig-like domain-containing protein [Acinetobacter]ENV85384.1 hypothetical protein F939_02903 [Acinetobacter radioresistens DSM 6976 = NBRC 102413 = CIP 103788]EXB31733.1 hypothetical protein J546_2489 [Acinetobacter sp. 1461402]EXB69432.1 hypothetical protein J550_2672 [Acinetobacter sp. 230853]EXC33345.1 hypothetical protein J520_1125 [Acinetobacter sp. 869535]EXE13214.1 hypothetical protein J559_2645 [Acinetobacter sp. 983759]